MRYSASEKYEIIRLVESSSLSARQTLRRLDIHRSTFYNWLHRLQDGNVMQSQFNSEVELAETPHSSQASVKQVASDLRENNTGTLEFSGIQETHGYTWMSDRLHKNLKDLLMARMRI